jgi:2,4-dienoyl-CoA reductase-like NADH-dependent reductase (Old Yellow Enzyme family)
MNNKQNHLLLTPIQLSDLKLPNRVVTAPMTRGRAKSKDGIPTDLAVTYYSQRATAGLIISEGTWVNDEGIGYDSCRPKACCDTDGNDYSGYITDSWRFPTCSEAGS